MRLKDLINEINFKTYNGYVRIRFVDSTPFEMAELMRALPGVTTVTNAGSDDTDEMVTLKIKLITTKSGEEAFRSLESAARSKYNIIKKFEIAIKTIEQK